MTEVDFDRKYTMDRTVKSTEFDNESQAGMLETYGDDVKQVMRIANTDPLRVWTMVDGDDGMYLVQGFHLVNRIYYVITQERAENENEEYLFELYDDSYSESVIDDLDFDQ